MSKYNIVDRPIFMVRKADSTSTELGILDTLREAGNIKRIGGSSPLQEFLFVRILLAVLYRALDGPKDTDEWYELWDAPELPLDKIERYLQLHHERFDLLHPETPFYQIAGAEYERADTIPSPTHLLIDQQPIAEGKFLFSMGTNKGFSSMTPAEAGRKLIELQSYNTASRKSVIKGDNRTKKRSYAQQGWAGNFTGIMMLGENLKQTLLLNLVPFSNTDYDPSKDLPVWERPQQTAAAEGLHGPLDESRMPTGPCDLYTYQAARVTLNSSDGEVVESATVGIGDRIFVWDKHPYEPMATWRLVERSGDVKVQSWAPVSINMSSPWRGLASILAKNTKSESRLAANLDFFSEVEEEIKGDIHGAARIALTAVSYGTQSASISETGVDQISLNSEILTGDSAALQTILKMAELGNDTANAITSYHADLYVAEGKERDPKNGTSAKQLALRFQQIATADIGDMFSRAAGLVTQENHLEEFEKWRSKMLNFAKRSEEEHIPRISQRAIAGRMEKVKDKLVPMNAFVASTRLSRSLYKRLIEPYQAPNSDEASKKKDETK